MAVRLPGDLRLSHVAIANNAARATPGPDDACNGNAYGGGIFNGCAGELCGSLMLEDSMVTNNLAMGSDNEGDQHAGHAFGGGLYSDCPAIDQRGFPRPAAGSDRCDIGAYERPLAQSVFLFPFLPE